MRGDKKQHAAAIWTTTNSSRVIHTDSNKHHNCEDGIKASLLLNDLVSLNKNFKPLIARVCVEKEEFLFNFRYFCMLKCLKLIAMQIRWILNQLEPKMHFSTPQWLQFQSVFPKPNIWLNENTLLAKHYSQLSENRSTRLINFQSQSTLIAADKENHFSDYCQHLHIRRTQSRKKNFSIRFWIGWVLWRSEKSMRQLEKLFALISPTNQCLNSEKNDCWNKFSKN